MKTYLEHNASFTYDPEATSGYYKNCKLSGSEECACSMCNNYIAQRKRVLTEEHVAFISQFGIDPYKEIEVWEASLGPNEHFYGGWFFVVGNIEKVGAEFEIQNVKFNFSEFKTYTVDWFPAKSIFELNFSTTLPWVIDEPEVSA
jgi:hypothetical protein